MWRFLFFQIVIPNPESRSSPFIFILSMIHIINRLLTKFILGILVYQISGKKLRREILKSEEN